MWGHTRTRHTKGVLICEGSRTLSALSPQSLAWCSAREDQTLRECLWAHTLPTPLCWPLGSGPGGICVKGPTAWRVFPIEIAICSFKGTTRTPPSCLGPTLTVRWAGQ